MISLALADDYAKTTNGTTVAHDMTKVTNPPGTACYTYASCLALIKAGTKINYEGASGEPRLQPVQQHLRPVRRLPGHRRRALSSRSTVMSASALAAATP